MKRKYFGGDTLPGVYYHLAKATATVVMEEAASPVPEHAVLRQNVPNPFNAQTSIPFDLPSDGRIRLIIYNAVGERVRALVDRTEAAGSHRVTWDGRDDGGRPVASGVYVLQLRAGSSVQARKIALLR